MKDGDPADPNDRKFAAAQEEQPDSAKDLFSKQTMELVMMISVFRDNYTAAVSAFINALEQNGNPETATRFCETNGHFLACVRELAEINGWIQNKESFAAVFQNLSVMTDTLVSIAQHMNDPTMVSADGKRFSIEDAKDTLVDIQRLLEKEGNQLFDVTILMPTSSVMSLFSDCFPTGWWD